MIKILRSLVIVLVLLFLTGQAFAWNPTGQMWVKDLVTAAETYDDGTFNGSNEPTLTDSDYQMTVLNTAVQTYGGEGNRQDAYPNRLTIYVITSAVTSGASLQIAVQDSPDNTNWVTLKTLTPISATGTVAYRTGAQSTDLPESFGKYLRISFTINDGNSYFTERVSFSVKAVFRAG